MSIPGHGLATGHFKGAVLLQKRVSVSVSLCALLSPATAMSPLTKRLTDKETDEETDTETDKETDTETDKETD